MLFKNPPKLTSTINIYRYLTADFWSWTKDIVTGLTKMDFLENFDSFIIDNIEILNGQEVKLPNLLKNRINGAIPRWMIIVKQMKGSTGSGNANIIRADTPWTATNVYVKNVGAEPAIVSIIFYR